MTALDAALEYADMGLYVFPCNGKQPLVQWGTESTTDPEMLRKWWSEWPNAGIGVDCGKSGLVVIDLDVKSDADGPANWRQRLNGHQIPATFNVRTPSGGWHGWYRDPAGRYRNSAGLIAPGVDVRGVGGYVLAPGSPGYRWHAEAPFALGDIPAMPDGIIPAAAAGGAGKWSTLDRDNLDPRDRAALTALEELGGHGAYRSGDYIAITRPGKMAGASATIGHVGPGIARVFTPNWRKLREGAVYAADELIAIAAGEQPTQTAVDKLKAQLLDTEGLDHVPEPEPLIKGVMYRDSLVWLQGKSGDGKSFLALDMAGCIATGQPWQVYPTTRGEVLYIVAEGVSGIRWRVRAWEDAMGEPMTGIRWLPAPVQAADLVQWHTLIELATELDPALIVIDTQARVTVGLEENAAKDMGQFVEALERLRKASDACILVVHHQGRSGEHMRGSTALDGAANTILRVVKEDSDITLSCTKQKDAEPFDDIQLRLVPHGSSAVVAMAGLTNKVSQRNAMRTAAKWWDVFRNQEVSMTQLLDAEIASKATLYRHLRVLQDAGIVLKSGNETRPRFRVPVSISSEADFESVSKPESGSDLRESQQSHSSLTSQMRPGVSQSHSLTPPLGGETSETHSETLIHDGVFDQWPEGSIGETA